MALIKDGKVYRTFEEQLIYLTDDNKVIKEGIKDIEETLPLKANKTEVENAILIEESERQQDISSVNNSLNNLNTNKQDKLTAGDNITIDSNNVISASGGGNVKGTYVTKSFSIASNDYYSYWYAFPAKTRLFSMNICNKEENSQQSDSLTYIKDQLVNGYIVDGIVIDGSSIGANFELSFSDDYGTIDMMLYNESSSDVEFAISFYFLGE